ncbi:MAG: hypothetical protein WD824_04210 [Cyclobacteriaceae bacterium]
MALEKNPSSFRDPSGYVFAFCGEIYRNIDRCYEEDYKYLEQSGLLQKLFDRELLVRHERVELSELHDQVNFAIIKPEKIAVITYPYEWSFSQLKNAALLTLEILALSLEHDIILKDASAYNVQFKGYKPVFIDTLSFTKYEEGQPWGGYKQFCEHFLAPLLLSHYRGAWYQPLLKVNVDGIPLPFTSSLLPIRSWFRSSALFHIHLHAKSISHYQNKSAKNSKIKNKVSKMNLLAMVNHLKNSIQNLTLNRSLKTEWQDYDRQTHYTLQEREKKTRTVLEFVNRVNPLTIWDLGANDGFFSRVVNAPHRIVLSMDSDPMAIEKNFSYTAQEKITTIYPLVFDATNPSPALGWANSERSRLIDRSSPDMIMALAVIHHLTITHNIPFGKVAEYMQSLAKWLIIEFVPEEDDKIKPLPDTAGKKLYNRQNFNKGFLDYFDLIEEKAVTNPGRSVLLLKRK